MTTAERVRQSEAASQYDARGLCEMCGAHRRDHGVGEKCPERRGASDLPIYDLGPRQ